MSKSSGNFVTMAELLDTTKGEIIRHSLLQAQYRGPLDFSLDALKESEAALNGLYRAVGDVALDMDVAVDTACLDALADDMNTPLALSRLHKLASMVNRGDASVAPVLKRSAALLGLLPDTATAWFQHGIKSHDAGDQAANDAAIQALIEQREQARADRDFAEADRIRDQLAADGITLEDKAEGTVWRRS
jgi:cysteinyl-tRNA synthetase